jgi:RHS repeat-associated protein
MDDNKAVNLSDILVYSGHIGQTVPPGPSRLDLSWDGTIDTWDIDSGIMPVYGLSCPLSLKLTCIEYNAAGLPTAVVESTDLKLPSTPTGSCTGNKTVLAYDGSGFGNLTSVVNPRFAAQGTPSTQFTYDLGGRLLSRQNELGHTTTLTNDNFNMPLAQTDNLGHVSTWTYDSKGNLKTITDAKRTAVGTAESGSACGTSGTGNGTDDDADSTIDDGCPNTIYSYDSADRLTSVTDALGHVTTYAYDANDNLTAVTDANRQVVGTAETCGTSGVGDGLDSDSDGVKDDGCPSTIYAYDSVNRLHTTTDALAHVTTYEYDAASNLTKMSDPRSIDTFYAPDALNRLHTIQYKSGSTVLSTTTYGYDDAGNLSSMVDVNGETTQTTTYTHGDGLNRLTQVGVTYPAAKSISYTYDAVGNISILNYPLGTGSVTYQYNKDHSMSSVQQSWGSVGATTYTYDIAGNLTKTLLPNGAWTDYGYDNADRLTSTVNKQPGPTTMSTYTYTLDKDGNRTGMTGTGGPQTYTLDPLNRLTQATYPGPVTDTYIYDADGNRTYKNSTLYTNDAADELTAVGSTSYTYDQNGNLATRGSDTFTFNYANQLAQTVVGGTTATSTYNGDGLRMSHTVGAATSNYLWDVNRSVPEILQDGTNSYVYGLGLISSTNGSGVQTYYDSDGLGSTTDLTNSSATKTDGYTYDAFGTPTHTSGSSTQPFQFAGQQTDADSGLQYLRARYYDPGTGRFLSRDPLGIGNGYSYASNNPVNLVDPTGLCPLGLPVCPPPPPLPPLPVNPWEVIAAAAGIGNCILDGPACLDQALSCLSDLVGCTYSVRAQFTIWLEQMVRDRVGGTSRDKEGGITLITGCGDICDFIGVPFTIGHTIFTNQSSIPAVVLAHETRHVRQYEVLGDLFWYVYIPNNLPCFAYAAGGGSLQDCVHSISILERQAGRSQ